MNNSASKGNNSFYRIFKQLFDLIFAFFIMIIFSPLFLLISILVIFETKNFPIIVQERGLTLTKNRIRMFKFRTFRTNAKNDNGNGILNKRGLKSNVGPICKLLRKTGLDEIPQFINVLKGDMCIIGVRPLNISDLEKMLKEVPKLYKLREKLEVPLGITGLWQINKDDDLSVENLLNMDFLYQKNMSISFDLKIILKTIILIFSFKHKDSIFS